MQRVVENSDNTGQVANSQEIEVLLDGNQVGTADITPASTQYDYYKVPNISITYAGAHTLEFLGLNPQGGDNTALIDNVSLVDPNNRNNSATAASKARCLPEILFSTRR